MSEPIPTALSDLARAALADAERWEDSIAGLEASYERMHKREPELARGVLALLAERVTLVSGVQESNVMVLGLTKQLAESEETTAQVCRDWAAETADLTRQLAEAKAEIERLRPVIDAATKWAETDWCTCHQPHCDECELRRTVGRTKGTP